MKKIILFIATVFAINLTMAQVVSDWDPSLYDWDDDAQSYTMQISTESNMPVIFTEGTFNDYIGGQVMAFLDGIPVSAPGLIDSLGKAGVTVIGQDPFCGAGPTGDSSCLFLPTAGQAISFAILMDGQVIVITSLDPPLLYLAGTFPFIDSESTTFSYSIDGDEVVFGCTDPLYLEHNANANLDDDSCVTLAVPGCTDAVACNYDSAANVDDGSCDLADSACETCEGGASVLYDADGDGFCDLGSGLSPEEVEGCQDNTACNFDVNATDPGSCDFKDDVCEVCEGGASVLYDADGDGFCDLGSGLSPEEVYGCTDDGSPELDANGDGLQAYNYNPLATEDDGSCYPIIYGCINPSADNFNNTGDLQTDANTDDGSCTYSGINPWGPGGGSPDAPTFNTANNMSVLFQAGVTGNQDSFTGLDSGDVVMALYETSRLENDFFGYSEVSGMASAGALLWTGVQDGMPVFGAGNAFDYGFAEGETITWAVEKGDTLYHATLVNPTGQGVTYDIPWVAGEFVLIYDIEIGDPFYDGCMDPTVSNYNPMATNDDGSCTTPISVGCMDANAVNFAGPGANPTHENAENYGDPFIQNLGYNLNTDQQFPSGAAANVSNNSMCQSQIEGCTDPMAINYDPLNTQNDNTICDWTLNGMAVYDVDVHGNILDTVYNFGAVAPDNVNDGILNSDFERAQQVFDEGGLDPQEHVIDNLASLMEWVDMDEDRDERNYFVNDSTWSADYDTLDAVTSRAMLDTIEATSNRLADSLSANYLRYHLNDSTWSADFDTLDAQWSRAMLDTIDATSNRLADSLSANYLRYHLNDSTWSADYDTLIAVTTRNFNAMVAEKDSIYAYLMTLVTGSANGSLDYNISDSYYHEGEIISDNGILAELQSALDYHSSPILIDLQPQWNTVAYYLQHKSSVVAQFVGQFETHQEVADNINIVKNNEGLFYWPEFNFDGLKTLIPGEGYQVRVKNESDGKSDFVWDSSIHPSEERILNPTVPNWALEMEVDIHPNDIRTLVRVVNMLGQEVNPANQFKGEVLLYMYNDGTVEKLMVK